MSANSGVYTHTTCNNDHGDTTRQVRSKVKTKLSIFTNTASKWCNLHVTEVTVYLCVRERKTEEKTRGTDIEVKWREEMVCKLLWSYFSHSKQHSWIFHSDFSLSHTDGKVKHCNRFIPETFSFGLDLLYQPLLFSNFLDSSARTFAKCEVV